MEGRSHGARLARFLRSLLLSVCPFAAVAGDALVVNVKGAPPGMDFGAEVHAALDYIACAGKVAASSARRKRRSNPVARRWRDSRACSPTADALPKLAAAVPLNGRHAPRMEVFPLRMSLC